MGLRRPLPQPSTPRRRPATLVALLQRAPTAQLARRPTPDQPRLQPPWAGQLAARDRVHDGRDHRARGTARRRCPPLRVVDAAVRVAQPATAAGSSYAA